MKRISIDQARAHLRSLLIEGAESGDEFLIQDAAVRTLDEADLEAASPPFQFKVRVSPWTSLDDEPSPPLRRHGYGLARSRIRFLEAWDTPIEVFDFRDRPSGAEPDAPVGPSPRAPSSGDGMSYLVDTYPLLWYLQGDRRLSRRARTTVENAANTILVSAGSLWEIAILQNLDRLSLKMPDRSAARFDDWVRTYVQALDIDLLGLAPRHLDVYARLPIHHPDLFDRIVIAQAQADDLTIITTDERFSEYDVRVLW